MKDTTKFVGLDVSKEKIAVGIADRGREPARYWGAVENSPEALRKLMGKLGEPEEFLVCYEAGPTGYVIQRQLEKIGERAPLGGEEMVAQVPRVAGQAPRRPGARQAGRQ